MPSGGAYYTSANVLDPETGESIEVVTGIDFATGEVLLEAPAVHPLDLLLRPTTQPHPHVHWVVEMHAAADDPCVAALRRALEARGWVVHLLVEAWTRR